MEREGCVASTQAAAFLQTAVAPQPHKQPHICDNLQAPQPHKQPHIGGNKGASTTSTLLSLNLTSNPCRKRGPLSIFILTIGRGPPALQIVTF